MTVRAPNAAQALRSILRCTLAITAEAQMADVLARAWEAGRVAGLRQGVADANDLREPKIQNPYRKGQ